MSVPEDFVVIDTLRVDQIIVEPKRVQATYTAVRPDGTASSMPMAYSYESPVFDPANPQDRNLAGMMLAQVALNYGLFCKEIILDGPFDNTDRKFIREMMENTSREILTNKLLAENPFVRPGFKPVQAGRQKRYTRARLIFAQAVPSKTTLPGSRPVPDYGAYAILSSGGKDSLLSYGLARELGEAHPIFINESGRHWFTAVNAYRAFREKEPNTGRVWTNSDRVFSWMLKQLPFIRADFSSIRSDNYPIRLWTVAVFIFGAVPIALKRGAGNLLIGNEYDTTVRCKTQGIGHYCGLYDQSKFFDNALTRYYRKKGWHLKQFSLLRSLSELLIMKILTERYPELQSHQVSCHAAHEAEGRMRPCGKCEKCRRIIGMMTALKSDPGHCGYTPQQVSEGLTQLASNPVKQLGSDSSHLYHLLLQQGSLPVNDYTRGAARPHPEILKLRFDMERSCLEDLPMPVRKPLFRILEPYAEGCVRREAGTWQPYELQDMVLEQTKYTPYAI
ncbi:hypothetical protein [Robiginitalea marina]|uniref:UDP-N-acetyl-alpha-D-muramoyl-L-alanyl-L-glutamate epimerase n=1 Tax=Robiginitalea marina TaxID=2954105 RepID=A0ABT1B0G8_9FLAO|nr:hypothetical protein [Robiginitalea marina]MCO5725747.1 hypothetical protein [Robiginitalea marina]